MKKYITIIALALVSFFAFSCQESEIYNTDRCVLVMTGTESNPIVKFSFEGDSGSYSLTVSSTAKTQKDITVSLAIDNSLVETYNSDHKTSYYALPDSDLTLDSTTVTIEAGKASSTIANLNLLTTENFVDGRIYIIPVTITAVDGDATVLEGSRTIYLRISRIVDFWALDISDYNMYSNYIFDDSLCYPLEQYTYEIKCFINEYHDGSEPISRLCQWTSKSESKSNMLRFGENGQDVNSLQWVNPAGNVVSKTRFATKTWYLISLTFDGSSIVMYVDGAKDVEGSGDGATEFQRFELGMSWGSGYPYKQRFLGRVAEVRVWDRVLSSSEIQLGIAGVDVESDGLVAYWKFNEAEGHIFHDSTGHGYDMDWSDTWRDSTENDVLENYDYSSYVENSWIYDSYNKCSN